MKLRIYYEDTDISGFVYHTNYLKYCERARSEIFFKSGIPPIIDDFHFVVKDISLKYVSPALFGDEVEVKTKVIKLSSASVNLEQSIYKDEQLLFTANIKLAHLKGDRPYKVDSRFRAVFEKLC
ncbi:MAG: 4-hydroxybenzoyl-CoA thioesterase family active site [uncultured Campylobacterales bacterium]|uniref:4-hydroxybenzoyl-CoA thioesterase family active site n=1 Tax=uncultured Campylobacterales bacterium TaxID=352960 RepID=A0A6S6SX35_9BACT|nr:MAG: 4-hydroxybenzoyl-CoA thioesterase family active site [uncultured Campylobacterales bacterium]